MRSDWRGVARNREPKRSMSARGPPVCINSMEQQARPMRRYQSEFARARFTAWSIVVRIGSESAGSRFTMLKRSSIALPFFPGQRCQPGVDAGLDLREPRLSPLARLLCHPVLQGRYAPLNAQLFSHAPKPLEVTVLPGIHEAEKQHRREHEDFHEYHRSVTRDKSVPKPRYHREDQDDLHVKNNEENS